MGGSDPSGGGFASLARSFAKGMAKESASRVILDYRHRVKTALPSRPPFGTDLTKLRYYVFYSLYQQCQCLFGTDSLCVAGPLRPRPVLVLSVPVSLQPSRAWLSRATAEAEGYGSGPRSLSFLAQHGAHNELTFKGMTVNTFADTELLLSE